MKIMVDLLVRSMQKTKKVCIILPVLGLAGGERPNKSQDRQYRFQKLQDEIKYNNNKQTFF